MLLIPSIQYLSNRKKYLLISILFLFSCRSKEGECLIIYDKRQIEESYFFLWERELDWNNGVDDFQSRVNQLKVLYDIYSRFSIGDEFCRE